MARLLGLSQEKQRAIQGQGLILILDLEDQSDEMPSFQELLTLVGKERVRFNGPVSKEKERLKFEERERDRRLHDQVAGLHNAGYSYEEIARLLGFYDADRVEKIAEGDAQNGKNSTF